MIHSPQGAIALREAGVPDADARVAALAEQATEEMRAAHQTARREPARRVQELEGSIQDLERQLTSLGVSGEAPVFGPRIDMPPRLSTLIALLLTAAIAAAAAFASGSMLGLRAPSTYGPEIAVVVLGALVGGIAGDTLARTRARWAIGIAAGVAAIGAISAYLVSWAAGLLLERRLLIALLFLLVVLAAGALWALRALSRGPRDGEAHEVAIARRVAARSAAGAKLHGASADVDLLDSQWAAGLLALDALGHRALAPSMQDGHESGFGIVGDLDA